MAHFEINLIDDDGEVVLNKLIISIEGEIFPFDGFKFKNGTVFNGFELKTLISI